MTELLGRGSHVLPSALLLYVLTVMDCIVVFAVSGRRT